ncbi:MAG: SgcJ/EcaC family oxidoreductase [Acidobacteriota bacterium]|nr:SgcJ/EcaC family oxidoreductase [Acidobacteriota bacterium]
MQCISVLFIVLILIAPPGVAQTKGNAKDKEAIKSIALKWQDTWNRHDMKALAALVAEDADLITVGGTWLRSGKEFEEDHAKSHTMMFKESVLTTNNLEVKFIRPDVAVAHVEWSIKGVKDPDGMPRQPQQGISTWVVEKRKGTWLIIAAQNNIAFSGQPTTQSGASLAGTWRLVSAWASTASGGRNNAPFGSSPTGFLTYTREGRMTAILSHGGRKPLSGSDRISAPADERAEAFATFFGYAGRYSLTDDKVIHHVEISSVPNWVNTDLIRVIKFEGDRIIVRTPPMSVGGTIQTTELVFERVK